MCIPSYPFFFYGLTAVHLGLEYQHGGRWFMYPLRIRLFFAVYCANRACYDPGVLVPLQSLQAFEMRPMFVRGVYCPCTCATTHRLIGAMSGTAPQLDSPRASLCVWFYRASCALFSYVSCWPLFVFFYAPWGIVCTRAPAEREC